ncbi:MAG TPA: winged helix DNA-binding domain-containing protein [Solirubrobacteraceae bacterium]|nr:winged helix DNA-binding domain-containing protein [Solirubrobacteraceae bacterium]
MLAVRLTSQLLAGEPARDPLAVTRRLLAIQGQDPRGARLAIRARSEGLSAADVDRALTRERTLTIAWLNRGTLHLVASEDYPWLHSLVAPTMRASARRRLAAEEIEADAADRALRTIERSIADEGPLTRIQLRERIASAGVTTEGQSLLHLLFLASMEGLVIRGPMHGREHAYVLVSDWLGEPPRVRREQALAELARRYLAGHAPANERDLAYWAGLPLRDARSGLAAIASELRQRPDKLLELERTPPAAPLPPPRLLGAFDPLLHGWPAREPILGENQTVVTRNGIFRPIALVEGRAVATWSMPRGRVELTPFGRLSRGRRDALEADARDVLRYLAREGTRASA